MTVFYTSDWWLHRPLNDFRATNNSLVFSKNLVFDLSNMTNIQQIVLQLCTEDTFDPLLRAFQKVRGDVMRTCIVGLALSTNPSTLIELKKSVVRFLAPHYRIMSRLKPIEVLTYLQDQLDFDLSRAAHICAAEYFDGCLKKPSK